MSTPLAIVDLTGAVVGQIFKLDFTQFVKFNPANMQQKAHIALFNESGDGLQIAMQASGNGQYLPAGAWVPFEIQPNDGSLTATVTYVLPNPPVSQLNAVYFAPGEAVPTNYTLGNSPIGIGGTVNTSSVQTLSNENNASNVLVEDIGDIAFAQLFTIYTDGHCLWAVDQSGVKHQVLTIQTIGNPLQLGQSGDVTEILGALTVDQTSILTGVITAPAANIFGASGNIQSILGQLLMGHEIIMPNNVAIEGKSSGGTAQVMLSMNTDNSLRVSSGGVGSTIFFTDNTNGAMASLSGAGISAPNGVNYNVGRIKDINNGSNLSGTINHGLSGVPAAVLATCDTVSSSATVGASSYTSTQFGLTIGSGLNGRWVAYR